jgi:CMP-N,N'-diacetyllegionaminic acid synthase
MKVENYNILGIIPARGGSKGVIRKNIRLVADKPLIHWSIAEAKKSTLLSNYYVTTDDDEIAEVATLCGAQVIDRPSELAQDKTPMIPVLQHLCREAELLNGIKYDYILLMQPTAPMRTSDDIDKAIELLVSDEYFDSLVSVYQVDDCHPSRMYTCDSGRLIPFYEEPAGSLRQDLLPVYHRNGAIYMSSRKLLMADGKLVSDNTLAYVMSKNDSANIDDEDDLLIADFLMKKRLELK